MTPYQHKGSGKNPVYTSAAFVISSISAPSIPISLMGITTCCML